MQGAIAEADRLTIEERRLEVEAQARAHEDQIARDRRARANIDAELARQEAARVAIEQGAAAFELAASDEGRRYRGRATERARLHREAAEVLRRRATLMMAAASALGGEEASARAVDELVARSERSREPAASLRLAERAARMALRALGEARAGREVASGQRQALIEAATAAGFDVEQLDRGLVVRAKNIFVGRGTRPSPQGRRRLAQLAAIVVAHPQGQIQVQSYALRGNVGVRQRFAQQRAESAIEVLGTEGVPRERLHAQPIVDEIEAESAEGFVEVVFLAFSPTSGGPA